MGDISFMDELMISSSTIESENVDIKEVEVDVEVDN
jgi:hypothetical protein